MAKEKSVWVITINRGIHEDLFVEIYSHENAVEALRRFISVRASEDESVVEINEMEIQ